MTGRQETNPDGESAKGLTAQQAAAVDLLAVGTTVAKTTESVGVTRQTVSEWVNRNWGLKAALNARRLEIWQQLEERLRSLVSKAVDVLDRSLDHEGKPAFDASVHLLKACGLYGSTGGYTEAEDFEIAEREAAGERRRRLMLTEIRLRPRATVPAARFLFGGGLNERAYGLPRDSNCMPLESTWSWPLACILAATMGCGDTASECVESVVDDPSGTAIESLGCPRDIGFYFNPDEGVTRVFCYPRHSTDIGEPDLPDSVCDPRYSSGRGCRAPLANPSATFCYCLDDRVGQPGGIPLCPD